MPYTITQELKRVYHLNYVGKPENRLKLRCRERCAYAIKTGKLTRLPCEKCAAEKSEAHHEDYSKPFDVIWLCRKCHGAKHRKSRRPRRAAPPKDVAYLPGKLCREMVRPACREVGADYCVSGHKLSGDNKQLRKNGNRTRFVCRACARTKRLKWRYTAKGIQSHRNCNARYELKQKLKSVNA